MMITSTQWEVEQEQSTHYYEDVQKRSFIEKCRKIRNTILALMAYACPNNKLRIYMQRKRGVHIGEHVYIGMFCYFDNIAPEYIYIEDNASVNAGTMILTHFTPMAQYEPILQARVAPVVIGKSAIVAVRSTIMPNVRIGQFAIVNACALVEKSVKDYTMVKGNPAKQISEYKSLLCE